MPLKPRPVQLHSFLCGGLHDRGIVVTGRALRTGHDLHRPGTAMFLMANRTRAILDDVRFVEGERSFVSFEMAGFAILVDRIKGDALVKPIAQHILEFVSGQLAAGEGDLVVTARTSVDQSGVAGGKRSRVKKSLVAPPGKSDNRGETGGNGEKADEETGRPAEVDPAEITEIALVLPGDLFLCLARRVHELSVVE